MNYVLNVNNNIKRILLLMLLFYSVTDSLSQGAKNNFLLGYSSNPNNNKGRIIFSDTSYSIITEIRKISFWDTQANISDENGNLLMSSNGIFIADATGDTMQGGGGLNPNSFTDDFKQYGLPIPYGNIILPMPDDTNKYVLFHQTGDYNNLYLTPSATYYSIIDISLNNGLGQVISKNNVLMNAMFGAGLAACKHGNGRDWWVIALSDSATVAYKFLLTPDTIMFVNQQNLPIQPFLGFAGQPTFSPDGKKFAFASGNGDGITGYWSSRVQLFDFDRCDGTFILDTLIDYSDGNVGLGTAFSPNSKYLYFSTTEHIYQINADTSDIGSTFQLVATNDTFLSVFSIHTNFFNMYLAANGKIYISSTSSVRHLHEINYPESAGTSCNVNLHNVYTGTIYIGVPNHPNYYLGRKIGSPCDTIPTGFEEKEHDFKFKIFPNPNNGNFKIMYLLPQNKAGKLEIFDINGRAVYSQNLPQWSTLQFISLPKLSNGIYAVKINSNNFSVTKKLIIHHE
ncbi:MAG: T9SS type A sorting domain-containing protein [Bacteroidetes bacterium]|nr:T9SS type A sorting domain-containing protein [Bacteroidota bacterium]